MLRGVQIFSSLSDEQWTELARARECTYAPLRELIVRQGDAGSSMFVVSSRAVSVTLDPSGIEVAQLRPRRFFWRDVVADGEPARLR
jgi:signal-transduction protein with cAMP-binding, CBS, and nucleotidyltransferase domain